LEGEVGADVVGAQVAGRWHPPVGAQGDVGEQVGDGVAALALPSHGERLTGGAGDESVDARHEIDGDGRQVTDDGWEPCRGVGRGGMPVVFKPEGVGGVMSEHLESGGPAA